MSSNLVFKDTEFGDFFEGDMVMRENDDPFAPMSEDNMWPEGTVYYEFSTDKIGDFIFLNQMTYSCKSVITFLKNQ